jgi:hypothetical protein
MMTEMSRACHPRDHDTSNVMPHDEWLRILVIFFLVSNAVRILNPVILAKAVAFWYPCRFPSAVST